MNSLMENNTTMARCTCEGSAMLLIIMIIMRIYLFFRPFKFVPYEKLEILTASLFDFTGTCTCHSVGLSMVLSNTSSLAIW